VPVVPRKKEISSVLVRVANRLGTISLAFAVSFLLHANLAHQRCLGLVLLSSHVVSFMSHHVAARILEKQSNIHPPCSGPSRQGGERVRAMADGDGRWQMARPSDLVAGGEQKFL